MELKTKQMLKKAWYSSTRIALLKLLIVITIDRVWEGRGGSLIVHCVLSSVLEFSRYYVLHSSCIDSIDSIDQIL